MHGNMVTSAEAEGCMALYVGNLHPYVNELCLHVRASRCPPSLHRATPSEVLREVILRSHGNARRQGRKAVLRCLLACQELGLVI